MGLPSGALRLSIFIIDPSVLGMLADVSFIAAYPDCSNFFPPVHR